MESFVRIILSIRQHKIFDSLIDILPHQGTLKCACSLNSEQLWKQERNHNQSFEFIITTSVHIRSDCVMSLNITFQFERCKLILICYSKQCWSRAVSKEMPFHELARGAFKLIFHCTFHVFSFSILDIFTQFCITALKHKRTTLLSQPI